MQSLCDYPWPGNIRELDHCVERAVLMAQGAAVQVSDLGLDASRAASPRIEEMSLEEVECLLIRKSLVRHEGNVMRAAAALGLSRSALYRRMNRHGLQCEGSERADS